MHETVDVRPRNPNGEVDDEGRLYLPQSVRDALELGPGDTVLFEPLRTDAGTTTFRLVKAPIPLWVMLDALGEEAIREYERGETISLEDVWAEFAAENNDDSVSPAALPDKT